MSLACLGLLAQRLDVLAQNAPGAGASIAVDEARGLLASGHDTPFVPGDIQTGSSLADYVDPEFPSEHSRLVFQDAQEGGKLYVGAIDPVTGMLVSSDGKDLLIDTGSVEVSAGGETPLPQAASSLSRLAFRRSYVPDSRDSAGRFLGGTETMSLVAHRGKLFAALGFWMDVPYLADKPTGPWTGAQVVVKDSAESPWRVDVSFGTNYLRTEALAQLTLTTDGSGNRLVPPVPLLVAGPSDQDQSGTKWATA